MFNHPVNRGQIMQDLSILANGKNYFYAFLF